MPAPAGDAPVLGGSAPLVPRPRRSASTIARLRGEIDIATTPALRERLFDMLRPGLRLLVIDLSRVSFCDAGGLAVLIGTQRRAAALRITVRLVAPRPQTAKLLRITGLDRSLTICATLTEALSGGLASTPRHPRAVSQTEPVPSEPY